MVLFLSMISVANAEPGIDFVGQTISPYGWTVDNYADGSSVCVV